MWLATTFIFAVIATAVRFRAKSLKGYGIGNLALMLWGAFVMILIDHGIAFMEEGGDFLSGTTDGMVESSILLGILMTLPVFAVWAISTAFSKSIVTCR